MNNKEKAVKILNDIGYECEYDKENDDIKIWEQMSDEFTLYFLNKTLMSSEQSSFSLSLKSSSGGLENFKELRDNLTLVIGALEKIKKLDKNMVY